MKTNRVMGDMVLNRSKTQVNGVDLSESRHIDITQLDNGKSATILEFSDNSDAMRRLLAMGIIPGTVITKKSAISGKGPVILEKDMMQFAIGFDMARKIVVEPLDREWEIVNE